MQEKTWPAVDLRATAAGWGVDLDVAFAQLRALYAEVDARNVRNTAHLDLPCHRGCDMCCHESVFLTPLEFMHVWDWVQRELSPAARGGIIARGLNVYRANRDLIEALESPPPDGESDHLTLASRLKFTCPLLGDDGACRAYPARELYARLFGSSFLAPGAVYGCPLIGSHLADRVVTLQAARPVARRLALLPLTGKRQVYPWYIHLLHGPGQAAGDPATPEG